VQGEYFIVEGYELEEGTIWEEGIGMKEFGRREFGRTEQFGRRGQRKSKLTGLTARERRRKNPAPRG
jgi:hypothetical protein